MSEDTNKATVERVPFCLRTNTELEAGKTCGLPFCPNAPTAGEGADVPTHPRLTEDGEAIGSVVIEEGRPDDRALELLRAHPLFAQGAFAWMGAEHLGGGLFCASVYSGTAPTAPTSGSPRAKKTRTSSSPASTSAAPMARKRKTRSSSLNAAATS